MRRTYLLRTALALVPVIAWLCCGGNIATAQTNEDNGFQLPTDPSAWVNSAPISSEALKGKAAYLYFYEEGCPRCRAKWPALIAAAKKYEGKPVVFIAVNSGTNRGAVEQYARGVQLPWPVIVDADRSLERAAGVGEISLQNIYQAKLINADGSLVNADYDDPGKSAEKALATAKWTVDPAEIPAPLKTAWLAIELNNFAAAGPLVKKSLASNKAEVKAGAERLNEAVQEKMTTIADAAKQADEAGEKWPAYKGYQQLTTKFAGFTLPEGADAAMKLLAEDDGVKKELAASKAFDAARKVLSKPGAVARSGIVRLKKLVTDFPGTEAAAEAEKLLAQIGGQ